MTPLDNALAEFHQHMADDGIVPVDVISRLTQAGVIIDDIAVTKDDGMRDFNPDSWFIRR